MTQFALQLATTTEARVLTDQLASSPSGQTILHYKPHKLLSSGCVLTGRGATAIFDRAGDALESAKSFDEAKAMLGEAMKQARRDFVLEMSEGLPPGYTIDQWIESIINTGDEVSRHLFNDAFLLGYSEENQSMGVAHVRSYQDYKLQEIYKVGFFYFIQKEAIEAYVKELGRLPSTKEEMAEGLRRSYQAEKKRMKQSKVWAYLGGGNIDCTIIKSDGTITVEDLGPLEQPNQNLKQPNLQLVKNDKVGRNAPCPCGSGKKFKKCCA